MLQHRNEVGERRIDPPPWRGTGMPEEPADLSAEEALAMGKWLDDNSEEIYRDLNEAQEDDHFVGYQVVVRDILNGMREAAEGVRDKARGARA